MSPASAAIFRKRWQKIDKFCDQYNLDQQTRVLLSMVADQILHLSFLEIDAICAILTDDVEQRKLACEILYEMQQDLKGYVVSNWRCVYFKILFNLQIMMKKMMMMCVQVQMAVILAF